MQCIISLPVYGFKIHVGYAELPKKGCTALDSDYKGICCPRGADIFVHVVKESLGTLVHELTHALNFIFEYIEAEPSFSDDEVWAYHMTYLVNECTKAISKESKNR